MNEQNYNIMLCGVGGQGLMVLSNILGAACNMENKYVITGEQHGLSQRSGTINVHFRIGDTTVSPLIPFGKADLIIATEAMEALRYIEYLKDNGYIIMNSLMLHPPLETHTIINAQKKNVDYLTLDRITTTLNEVTEQIIVVDALNIAKRAGTAKSENIVLLGVSCKLPGFPLSVNSLRESIKSIVPPKTVESNLKAFEMGMENGKTIY